ncbi:MAG TPA: tetratricopeptide repeat protein [Xanthobacteraceae bacterium]|nr:tetratricopeptide repeat protein [Xanthobacteraceae bacterium]
MTASTMFSRLVSATLIASGLLLTQAASAQVPTQQELLRLAPLGAYLAARHAGADRDAAAQAAYYRAALRADPNNKELLERAFLALLASGEVEESGKLADRIVQTEKSHRIARLTLGIRAIKQKQYQTARQQLELSVGNPVTDLAAALLLGWAAYGAEEARSAVEAIDKLPGPDWYGPFKDMHAGLILELSGTKKEAGKRFEHAYKLDPNDTRLVEAYAGWAGRNGAKDEALKTIETYQKVSPRQPLILTAKERIKRGARPSLIVNSPQEGAAEALYGMGTWISRRGGEDLGLVYLQLALYLHPTHPLALIALADLYSAVKKPELAIKLYERVPANSPMRRNANIQLAIDLDGLERTDEARKLLDKLIAERPKDVEAILALGHILRGRKKYAECADVYSKAIATITSAQKSDWLVYYFRGICFERARQWDTAEADLKKALELFPEQPQVLNYLGYSWIDQGVNLDEGMRMIRRAVEQRPEDGYIIDSLGWAYYRLGQFDEAVKHLERAVELRPEDPTINDHLGDVYWRVGRLHEAKFQWSHAKDLKPEPEELLKIEEKLKVGLTDNPSSAAEAEKIKKSRSGG